MRSIVGVGNCQVYGMVQSAAAVLGMKAVYLHPGKVAEDPKLLSECLTTAEVVFARGDIEVIKEAARTIGRPELSIVPAPRLHFSGFHPDATTPVKSAGKLQLPMGNANSAILLAAWREGLKAKEALSLFRDEVYEALGYYEAFPLALEMLTKECRRVGLNIEPLLQGWMANAPFFYVPLHPKIEVLRDIAFAQLVNAKIIDATCDLPSVDDELSKNLVWPVYPEIAQRLGFGGNYVFQPLQRPGPDGTIPAPIDLEEFVERTLHAYDESPPDLTAFSRMGDPRFASMRRFLNQKAEGARANPYKSLPATNWWSSAVAQPAFQDVDPVQKAKFRIEQTDKVATAGSCFAQHIARRLETAGFNYLVTERAPVDCPDPTAANYGTFTARFGNIYTVRQLLQLIERAYNRFSPTITAWEVAGGYVDPFRPKISARPFVSLSELRADLDLHLAAVRTMFETADVFVFTLGLTECWWAKTDQAVVPFPPQVVGATVDAQTYQAKNFTVGEVLADLESLIDRLSELNPKLRIVLTVSPVPLIATFEDDHVLSATTYSKSVLRAAAGETAKNSKHVAYFPAYEIVTGSFNRGRYFAEDLRQVTIAGVDHVMRSFLRNYAKIDLPTDQQGNKERFRSEAAAEMDIICDEEEIERSSKLA